LDENILEINNLLTAFDTDAGQVTAVDGVSFTAKRGRTLGIVGESGCGKSVTALSIIRLLPQPMGKILGGEILFNGKDISKISDKEMYKVRGKQIGMIFQEPMTALNPVHRIGRQLTEVFKLHTDYSKAEAWKKAIEILGKVGIPSPEIRVGEYPHQLRWYASESRHRNGVGLQPKFGDSRRTYYRIGCNDSGSDIGSDETTSEGYGNEYHYDYS